MFMYTEMYMNNAKECNDNKAGQQHYFLFPTLRQYRIQSILVGHGTLMVRILDNGNSQQCNANRNIILLSAKYPLSITGQGRIG